MAKNLISNGAILKNVESTFKLCNEIIENDIKKVEVNRNGKKEKIFQRPKSKSYLYR